MAKECKGDGLQMHAQPTHARSGDCCGVTAVRSVRVNPQHSPGSILGHSGARVAQEGHMRPNGWVVGVIYGPGEGSGSALVFQGASRGAQNEPGKGQKED